MQPPELETQEDWEPFDLPFEIGAGRPMFVETAQGPTILMKFFRRRSDSALVGRVWFGCATYGPPGFVHGGIVAYVFDEALGAAAWLAGYPSVAAKLDIDLIEMTPLETVCRVEATVVEVLPRKLNVAAEIRLDDRLLARCRSVFVRLPRAKLLEVARQANLDERDLAGYRLPD